MTTKPLWLIALALLVFPVARPAPAADPGGPGRPVCALLDPGKVPRAALLEAKLLADPTVTWVERANVDAVLGEQKLQSMFGPQGVGERARLGKLLKADVLVMIRAAQTERDPTAKGRVLEVVVSETTGGLRLLTRAIPETASAEADADALAAAVRSGIRKSREPVKGVVAVPPFACRNLVPEFDHLKWAYAKLAEAVAVAQPGVVVVELAEAEALGRELAVSAPGTRLVRPAPVYLMGEYRHEGKGADQLVTLTVRAERDGKAVGEPAAWKKTPADVPPALREWTAGVMGTVLGNRVGPPADAGAEAKVLAARARDFERTGDWSEALALIEAATLLAPDALDLRAAALPLITQKLRQIGADFGWRASTPDDVRLIHRLQARGLSHLGAFIDRDDDLRAYKEQGVAPLGLVFLSTLKWFGPHSSPAAGWPKEHLGPILEERRAVVLRWIPRVTRVIPRSEFYVRDAVAELPPRERYALTERIIIQLQDVPYPRARTMEYLRYAWEGRPRFHTRITAEDDLADCRAMLGRLARAENPEIRAAAAEFGRQLDDAMKPPVPLGPAPRPDGVGFQPIELLPQGNGLRARVEGIRSIGPGIDVVWGGSAIYLMKKKADRPGLWGGVGHRR